MSTSTFNQHLQTSIVCTSKYSIKSIASFREVPFLVMHSVKNTGNVGLNELIIEESIPAGCKPPMKHEIKLVIEHPEKDVDKNSPIPEKDPFYWDELENEVVIDENMIGITPDDQDFKSAHKIHVKLAKLKDTPIGIFTPNLIFRIIYPITAMKLAKDTIFKSKVRYLANTYPAGKPVEVVPPLIHIPVEHIRAKFSKGKEVRKLPTVGHYEIILSFMNVGTTSAMDVEIKDIVPPNFSYDIMSKEFKWKIRACDGYDHLIWLIPIVRPNENIMICYRVMGKGEYKAIDGQ